MSTPMFIALPIVGSGTAALLGQDLSAFSGATVMTDLTGIVDEPTLIEKVAWSTQKFSTALGMLILAVSDGTNRRLVGAYVLDAGTATLFASGTIDVSIVVPTGFKLVATHNTKDVVAAYTNVDMVPFGGALRSVDGTLPTFLDAEVPDPITFPARTLICTSDTKLLLVSFDRLTWTSLS